MELSSRMRGLFEGPNYAHVSTVMVDGSPQVVPVWIGTEGDRAIIFKNPKAIGYRNLKRDPRVGISIVASDNPYLGGYARGRAVDFREGSEAVEWLSETAIRYTGERYPAEHLPPATSGALVLIEIDRCSDFNASHMTHDPPSGA